MVNGIEGFLAGTVLDFATALPGSSLEKLKTTPGAYLAPAAISFLNLWKIRFTPDFFKNSEK